MSVFGTSTTGRLTPGNNARDCLPCIPVMLPTTIMRVDVYVCTQVVVDAFDPSVLVSDCATRVFDFSTMKEEELHDIQIPLDLLVGE